MKELKVITDCDGCGVCCFHIGKPPFLEHELSQLPHELREEVEKSTENTSPCIWLDLETRKCKNHEHRPFVCSEFEVGGFECHCLRAYYCIDQYR
jgi:Fe-S-cluster containining protein